MMKYKKILLTLLLIAGFVGAERFCHKKTHGFMLGKILWDCPHDARFEIPTLPTAQETEVIHLLDQPYYFLNSGGQSYAFISKDGQTVLKFFKMHHMREIPWLSKVPLPGILDNGRKRIVDFREDKLSKIFTSCKLAFEEMRDETAFLYCHINKTNHLNKKVVIYDKIGIRHTLDLDTVPFVMQKKVDLAFQKFHEIMKEGDVVKAQAYIETLLQYFLARYKKGIHDNDAIVERNFGFLGTEAIGIDLSCYSKVDALKDPAIYKQRFSKETINFKRWIKKTYPDLLPFLEQRIQSITSSEEEKNHSTTVS
ncbi:MAG: hypothetical protein HKM07_03385 [Chlamydiae bacterium]|nr:hypothetical protein [Chlamydiota bacterium]